MPRGNLPEMPAHIGLRYGSETDLDFVAWMWKHAAEIPVHAETICSTVSAMMAFKRHLRAHLAHDSRNLIVVDIHGHPFGFIFGYLIDKDPIRQGIVAHVESIYVDPALRGHGFGSALVQAFTADAKARGATEVTINVVRGNPALSLYRTLGFSAWQVTMRKKLDAPEGGPVYKALDSEYARPQSPERNQR